jgi:two-component system, chemotaxis family, CheB/CheR fusion protein
MNTLNSGSTIKAKLATRKKTTVATTGSKKTPKHFPIVGFGASAGGLEAFCAVLEYLSPHLGMAYVLIMHLSPKHKSALGEILQTKTKMKVRTGKDGMEVKPNTVYVIPPKVFMSIKDGYLKLAPRKLGSLGNFAVDYFLSALASQYKNNAIGVILSGTATDGTLGLRAIKAEGGISFAQDNSAKFPGMPKNAYDSGYADFILSPENIAKELAQLSKIPYTGAPVDKIDTKPNKNPDIDSDALKKILSLVKAKTSIDFFLHYKRASVYGRIVRRVALNKCDTLAEYCCLLERSEKEVDALYDDFLINVTSFFRDADFFRILEEEIFPSIVKHRKVTDPIRIWVAGCSTGEEPYSIAISLMEFLDENRIDITFQVFGSDLDAGAIEKARSGIYAISALRNISPARLKRFFRKVNGHYHIDRSVREVCIFSQQNLLRDPPFSRIDLISCQNVLIYLENSPQQRILQTFHYALKPSGYLFLGKSETIGAANDLFNSINKKLRIYTRKSTAPAKFNFSFNAIGAVPSKKTQLAGPTAVPDLEKDMGNILLRRYVLPSVVVDENLSIIQFFGVTAPYLSPVVGKASLNILKMIHEGLQNHIRTLLQTARTSEKIAIKEGIKLGNHKTHQEITIEVVPKKVANELYFLVVFKENQAPRQTKNIRDNKSGKSDIHKEEAIVKLEEELTQAQDIIRTTNEQNESTYEELQAYNEEILSSNEELQSINEELETSKEELQSANEELITINEELQKRNVELKDSRNYAKAIVDTVHNPFLVLTSNLQVKSANRSFYDTFKLVAEKTEGNFIYDLGDKTWDIPALREHLNELLAKKTNYLEFELNHFYPNVGQLGFIVNAYRLLTENGKEMLILLAFINISNLLKSNKELLQTNAHLEEFAFVASHDLQEPLRKIQLFSHLIAEHQNVDTPVKKYLDKISAIVERMANLLQDLLAYSTLLKNKEHKYTRVDLNITVGNICREAKDILTQKGGIINYAELPMVDAIPGQMHQLFYNLIMNALQFNNSNPIVNITVEKVSAQDYKLYGLNGDNRYVNITIADNGVGFDQQYGTKIFTIFQRLKDKPEVEGSGMGLAICKKIVEDHHGVIFAKSRKNEGAMFSLILPIIKLIE